MFDRKMTLFAGLALGWAVSAHAAAPSTSVDDIIKSLTPTQKALNSHTGRGIAAELPDAPDAAVPDRAPAHRAAFHHPATELAATDLVVHFPSGSADLTPAATGTLDELGQALSSARLASYRFRIEGHTDTVGPDDLNRELSSKRAEAVTGYLEQKYSIAADRLEAVGLGKEGLAVATPDQTPEARNRRVHIVNLGT